MRGRKGDNRLHGGPAALVRPAAARLKRIYDNRSKLVHGGNLTANELHTAAQEAAELAKAVTRRAIVSGWPDAEKLTALALTYPDIGQPPN